jgi:hypothetical protein
MRKKLTVQLDSRVFGRTRPEPPSDSWVVPGGQVGVDESAGEAGIVYGVVAAQGGTFSDERGKFNEQSLDAILAAWPAEGLCSHAEHPNLLTDKLCEFLGRCKNPRRGIAAVEWQGQSCIVPAIRCDLHFNPATRGAAINYPKYFAERIRTDAASVSASLVLESDIDFPLRNNEASLWTPEVLHSLDLVSRGAAVGNLLGHGALAPARAHQLMRQLAQQKAAPPKPVTIRGTVLRLTNEPVFSQERDRWEILSAAAIDTDYVPVHFGFGSPDEMDVHRSGRDDCSLRATGDRVEITLTPFADTTAGRNARALVGSGRAGWRTELAGELRGERETFRQPGHRLNGQQVYRMFGRRIARIVLAPNGGAPGTSASLHEPAATDAELRACISATRKAQESCIRCAQLQTPENCRACATACDQAATACDRCNLPECKTAAIACRDCAGECRRGPSPECRDSCNNCAWRCSEAATACQNELNQVDVRG